MKNMETGADSSNSCQAFNAQDLALSLIAKGFAPIPIPRGKKGPIVSGWQHKTFTQDNFLPNFNVGIRTGDGGVAFLDVDVLDSAITDAICAQWNVRFEGRGVLFRRTGRAPKTGIMFRTGTDVRKKAVKVAGDKYRVEVLATGQQFVAFGVHPETRAAYFWHGIDPTDPTAGGIDDLPFVAEGELDDFLSWIRTHYGQEVLEPKASALSCDYSMAGDLQRAARQGTADRKIISMLLDRRNNLSVGSYDTWRNICFGVCAEYCDTELEQEAYTAFFDWSARWENGTTQEKATEKLWKSWSPNWTGKGDQLPITPGTAVFHLQSMPLRAPANDPSWELNKAEPQKLQVEFTGLAAHLHKLILEASDRQPSSVHLAGVVSVLSALVGPCAVLQNGLQGQCCSNLYVLALAHTGFGKENLRKLISAVLHAANRSEEVFDSSPSDVSCHFALEKTDGRMALLIDEAGMLAKAIQSGNHSHQQMLMTFLMQAYGRGLSRIEKRQYSSRKKDIGAVENPRPTLMLTSTVTEFLEGTTRENSSSGFLNRFLAFIEPDYIPFKPRSAAVNGQAVSMLPFEVTAAAQRLQGNPMGPALAKRCPAVSVELTPDAKEALLDFKYEAVQPKQSVGGIRGETWVRAIENAQRLATCFAVSDALMDEASDLAQVSCERRHVDTALAIVNFALKQIEHIASNAGSVSSQVERNKDRVLNFIRESGGKATASQLGRGPLRGITAHMRNDLLQSMVLDHEVDELDVETGGRHARVYSVRT